MDLVPFKKQTNNQNTTQNEVHAFPLFKKKLSFSRLCYSFHKTKLNSPSHISKSILRLSAKLLRDNSQICLSAIARTLNTLLLKTTQMQNKSLEYFLYCDYKNDLELRNMMERMAKTLDQRKDPIKPPTNTIPSTPLIMIHFSSKRLFS